MAGYGRLVYNANMENKSKFKIGEGVSVTKGAMQGVYGTIVFFDEKMDQYLIRFGERQQLYYLEEQIRLWDQENSHT